MDNGNSTEESEMKKQFTADSLQLTVKDEQGIVLILSLLLLLVATVVGIAALSTSTTNVMIAGNQRLSEINFSAADGGVSVSVPIIETTAYDRAVSSLYTSYVISGDFDDEISGVSPRDSDTASGSPDLQFTLGSGVSAVTVSIDVDYLYSGYSAGSAIEFASGYEGLGKGAGAGGTEVYYSMNSVAAGTVGSESAVYAIYRYVAK
ncbi:MAG: hypothetical protein HZC11_05160 [Nitrospirae bacterium]|nr:hypothetical protein [Nitrospirota bacterium]